MSRGKVTKRTSIVQTNRRKGMGLIANEVDDMSYPVGNLCDYIGPGDFLNRKSWVQCYNVTMVHGSIGVLYFLSWKSRVLARLSLSLVVLGVTCDIPRRTCLVSPRCAHVCPCCNLVRNILLVLYYYRLLLVLDPSGTSLYIITIFSLVRPTPFQHP